MRSRPTLILLVLAALALGYFFLVEQPRHAQRLETGEQTSRLVSFPPEDVATVVVERPDATMEFVRSGEHWRMQRPVEDAAEDVNVNLLVHAITRARIELRFDTEAPDLGDFSLAPPQAAVRLLDASGRALLSLDVGSLTPSSEFAYARRTDGGDVLLVPTGIRRYALREMSGFRSRVVAEFAEEEVTSIEIASEQQTTAWSKTEDGVWVSHAGGGTLRGDADVISGILRRILALRAGEFVDEPPSRPEDPVGSITVMANGSIRNFTFTRADSGHCWVETSTASRIARVDEAILDVFGLRLDDLRDRHVLSFDAATVAKITLETPDLSQSIVKRGPEWTFANPDFGDIDQAAVSVLLRELENLKFRAIVEERLLDAFARGLDPAPYRLSLFDANDALIDAILASNQRSPGRIRYATSGTRHLGTVDTEPLDEIVGLFSDFRGP